MKKLNVYFVSNVMIGLLLIEHTDQYLIHVKYIMRRHINTNVNSAFPLGVKWWNKVPTVLLSNSIFYSLFIILNNSL
jgi:hypothetical protein